MKTNNKKTTIIVIATVILGLLALSGGCSDLGKLSDTTVESDPHIPEEDDRFEDIGYGCNVEFSGYFMTKVHIPTAEVLVPTTSASTGDYYKPSVVTLWSPCPVYGMIPEVHPLDLYGWILDESHVVEHGGVEYHQFATDGAMGEQPLCSDCGFSEYYFEVSLPTPPSGNCADYGEIKLQLNVDHDACDFYTGKSSASSDAPSTECTPGTGEFALLPMTDIYPSVGGKSVVKAIPVMKDGLPLSERAWIRDVKVSSWGAGDGVAIGMTGADAILLDGEVLDEASFKFSKAAPMAKLSPGDAHMGTYFLVEGVDPGEAGSLPSVEMSWTCECDEEEPHFEVIDSPDPYELGLDELGLGLGMKHKVSARLRPEKKVLDLALEGRIHDGHKIPLKATSVKGLWSFENFVIDGKAKLSGTVFVTPKNLIVNVDELNLGGLVMEDLEWVFPKKKNNKKKNNKKKNNKMKKMKNKKNKKNKK